METTRKLSNLNSSKSNLSIKTGKNAIPAGGVTLRFKAVLSDLDGTLVDSQHCVDYSWQIWAEDRGLDLEEVMRICHGRRTIETVKDITPHLDSATEVAFLEELEATCTKGMVPVLGAHDLVGKLGAHQFAVITSGSNRLATHRLSHVGFKIPKVFVTSDDVLNGKPHPEGYLSAAKQLGVEPTQCLVLEDSPAGIRAGNDAGMTTIGIAAHSADHDISHASYVVQDLTWLTVEQDGEEFVVTIKEPASCGTS